MKIPGLGCCCGIIAGVVLTVVILCAAAFGIYCYFNPKARNSAVNAVEEKWDKVKDSGDELIEKARKSPPEPVIEGVQK